MRLTPRRFESRVKCLASSSATFAQSRKYSTGRRSPLTSKSAKRAMISHARSIAYCSMLARASVRQPNTTKSISDLRSMRIRDFSVAPLPLAIQLLSNWVRMGTYRFGALSGATISTSLGGSSINPCSSLIR
jgi:hypothetical protein